VAFQVSSLNLFPVSSSRHTNALNVNSSQQSLFRATRSALANPASNPNRVFRSVLCAKRLPGDTVSHPVRQCHVMYTVVRGASGRTSPTKTQNFRFLSDASHLHGSEKAACSQPGAGSVQIASFVWFALRLTATKREIRQTYGHLVLMLHSGEILRILTLFLALQGTIMSDDTSQKTRRSLLQTVAF